MAVGTVYMSLDMLVLLVLYELEKSALSPDASYRRYKCRLFFRQFTSSESQLSTRVFNDSLSYRLQRSHCIRDGKIPINNISYAKIVASFLLFLLNFLLFLLNTDSSYSKMKLQLTIALICLHINNKY